MNFKHLIKTTLISALLFGASAFAEIKTGWKYLRNRE